MISSGAVLLSVALIGQQQVPAAKKPVAKPPVVQAQVNGQRLIRQPGVIANAQMSPQRQADIERSLRKRREAEAKKSRSKAITKARTAAEIRAQREYEIRMAPVVAQQQKEQALLQLRAAEVQAQQLNAAASMQRARTLEKALQYEAYRDGAPVMYGPGGPTVLPFGRPY
jgi:Tfp pilus assembly protein FimV